MEWLICIAIGAVSGFMAGLLGIGGGAIIMPALLYVLPLAGVGGPELMKVAVATSFAIVVPTAVASIRAHFTSGAVSREALARMTPGVVIGAMAGVALAAQVSSEIVTLVFIVFALHAAGRMIVEAQLSTASAPLPGRVALFAKSLGLGALSSLLGMAGGALVMPVLSRHMTPSRAIGTAAVIGLPLAAASVLAYALASPPSGCPQGCVGYVFLPAAGAVGVAAVLTAPWGARASHRLPVAALRRIFGCMLLLVAGNLITKEISLISREVSHSSFALTDARRIFSPLSGHSTAGASAADDNSVWSQAALGSRAHDYPIPAAMAKAPDISRLYPQTVRVQSGVERLPAPRQNSADAPRLAGRTSGSPHVVIFDMGDRRRG